MFLARDADEIGDGFRRGIGISGRDTEIGFAQHLVVIYKVPGRNEELIGKSGLTAQFPEHRTL